MTFLTFEPEDLDPQCDYEAHVGGEDEPDWDLTRVKRGTHMSVDDVLGVIRVAGMAMSATAEAVAEPYALRTTADVPVALDAIGQLLKATADTTLALGVWLETAHARDETAGPVARAHQQIVEVADSIRAAAGTVIRSRHVPADSSPGMDLNSIAEEVMRHLRERGVEVDDAVVSDEEPSSINWELPNDLHLSLVGGFFGWTLWRPDGNGNYLAVSSIDLPAATYAHPAYVADLVATYLQERPT